MKQPNILVTGTPGAGDKLNFSLNHVKHCEIFKEKLILRRQLRKNTI